jgi:DNA invertase Pin-like site-specific DNA recombinase
VHGKTLTPRNAMDKAMRSLQNFGDELHREQSSERTHAGHARRAQKGYCVGGRVFGYRTSTCIRAWTPKTAR